MTAVSPPIRIRLIDENRQTGLQDAQQVLAFYLLTGRIVRGANDNQPGFIRHCCQNRLHVPIEIRRWVSGTSTGTPPLMRTRVSYMENVGTG